MAGGCVGDWRIQNWVYTVLRSLMIVGFITDFVVLRGVQGAPYTQVRTAIGLKAKLPCSTEITGLIHVQWLDPSGTTLTYDETVETGDSRFKINHSYLKEWNLEIDNVRKSDAGNYTCNIGPTPLINNVVELIIVVAPSIVTSSKDAAFLVGSPVNLTCQASGDPLPVVSWSRLGNINEDKIDLGIEGTTFTIPSVKVEDAGTYLCLANNGVPPTAFERISINVLFRPELSVHYREVSQEVGGSTLMTCLVRANPATDLYWARSGQRVVESSKYQVHRWKVGEYQTTLGLFVNGLVSEDFGDYRCIATNEFGGAEEKIRINEFHTGSVRVLATPKDSLARVGDNVLFDCSVHGIDQGNSLTWWYVQQDGEYRQIFISHPSLDSVENSTGRSTVESDLFNFTKYEIRGHYGLLIKDVEFSDSGTYVCDITGHRNYSAELTVVDTSLSCENNQTLVNDGDAVSLVCSIAFRGLASDIHIGWLHDEGPVGGSRDDDVISVRRTLVFNASYPQSSGVYRCYVSSRQFNYSATCRTELMVLSPKTGNNVFPCFNTTTLCDDPSTNAIIIISLVSALVALLIAYIVTVCFLVTAHRRELTKYKQPQRKEKSTKNGNVDVELTPLTGRCTSTTPPPSV